MTNGDITKKILRATQTKTDHDLLETCCKLLRQFPLSSNKMVYDHHEGEMSEEAWCILMDACVKTDYEKLKSLNAWMRQMGAAGDQEIFGRYGFANV